MSVRKKWMILFAVLVIMLGVVIGIQSYNLSRTMVIESKKTEMQDAINRIDININFWVLQISKFAERTLEEYQIEKIFQGEEEDKDELESWLTDFAHVTEAIFDIAIIDQGGNTQYHYRKTQQETPDAERLQSCYEMAYQDLDQEYWLDVGDALYSGASVVTMVKAIPGSNPDENYGIFVVELNTEVFRSLLLNNQSFVSNQYMLIVDKSTQLVCGNEKVQPAWLAMVDRKFFRGNSTFEFTWGEEQYYVCGQYNGMTGWKTYSVVSIANIFPQLDELERCIMWIVVVVMLIALCFVTIFSYMLTVPINKLLKGMNEVEKGNFEEEIIDKRSDEFGQLFSVFNFMVRKIRHLIREVYQEKILQKNAEIRALQAQINPHFLYNTLDSIKWMLFEKEEFDIADVVISLGDILRYSISGKEGMVSLEDEIRYTKSYLCIQKNRMEDRLDYQITMEDEALQFKVPKLLLQPVVENAVLHGIEPNPEGGMIWLDGKMVDGRLILTIQDNGIGIPPEILREVRIGMRDAQISSEHIGMRNIQRRLELCYEEGSRLEIDSIEGEGTTVTLKIYQMLEKEGTEDGCNNH
jgi:two-component system sensor histidine kinase YesM